MFIEFVPDKTPFIFYMIYLQIYKKADVQNFEHSEH